MAITTLASLGMSCQSAHQLAHYAQQNPHKASFVKGPFDWLICPPDSLSKWLEAGLPDFQPSEITTHREYAWWGQYQFWFWHGFNTNRDGIKSLDIDANFHRELEKLRYQREQINKIDVASTLFVVSNSQNNLETDVFLEEESHRYHFSQAAIERLQSSLDSYFGQAVNLHVVSQDTRHDKDLKSLPNFSVLSKEHSEWKGDHSKWEELLNSLI